MPWCRKIEEEFERKLIAEADQGTVYCRFSVDGRARGTLAERNTAYNAGRQGGWYSANDIRELENQDRIEGGDEYLVPLNMAPSGSQTRSVPAGGSAGAVGSEGSGSAAAGALPQGAQSDRVALLPMAESIAKALATKEAKGLAVALKAPTDLDKQNNYRIFITDHTKLVAEKFAPFIASAAQSHTDIPKVAELYLEASNQTFAERLEAEFSTDEYINKLTDRFSALYKA